MIDIQLAHTYSTQRAASQPGQITSVSHSTSLAMCHAELALRHISKEAAQRQQQQRGPQGAQLSSSQTAASAPAALPDGLPQLRLQPVGQVLARLAALLQVGGRNVHCCTCAVHLLSWCPKQPLQAAGH